MNTAATCEPAADLFKDTLLDQVLERLRHAVLHGVYAPGQALRIDAIASAFGISQMPVREALHLLTMEGLAVRLPRRGVVVSPIGAEDIQQAYRTLAALEGESARAAAGRMDRILMKELRTAAADPAHDGDLAGRLAANRSLHDIIDRIAPNRWRDDHLRRLRNYIYRVRHLCPPSPQRRVRIRSEHAALIDALAAGDPAKAASAAMEHCHGACEDTLACMRTS